MFMLLNGVFKSINISPPVEGSVERDVETVVFHVVECFGQTGRLVHDLLGHTSHIDLSSETGKKFIFTLS